MIQGSVLVIDTATSRALAALGDPGGGLLASTAWTAGQRHSEELLPRVAGLLSEAGIDARQLGALIVGTGPGAFTGLRVGLATAKTLAHQLRLPIVGVSSAEALLLAARDGQTAPAGGFGPNPALAPSPGGAPSGAAPGLVLVLPAGSSDRLFVRPGQPAELLPGGREPDLGLGEAIVAVDLDGRADPAASDRGHAAMNGLARALLALGAARLARGEADDVERLVPEYVMLPRGVASTAGEISWSRDPR